MGEKSPAVIIRPERRLRLGDRGKHEADDERPQWHIGTFEEIAEHAEAEHHPHVEEQVVEREGADHAEHQDRRQYIGPRREHQLRDLADRTGHDAVHQDVGEQAGGDHRVDDLGIVEEQGRPRLDRVDHQGADQDGVDDAAGDAHGDQRNQGAADGGVVGRFRGDDSALVAGAEFLGRLGQVLRRRIGDDRADIGADPGQTGRSRCRSPTSGSCSTPGSSSP